MKPSLQPAESGSHAAAVLGAPLTLRCGVTLPNRLAKAAMSELLADPARVHKYAETRQTHGPRPASGG